MNNQFCDKGNKCSCNRNRVGFLDSSCEVDKLNFNAFLVDPVDVLAGSAGLDKFKLVVPADRIGG